MTYKNGTKVEAIDTIEQSSFFDEEVVPKGTIGHVQQVKGDSLLVKWKNGIQTLVTPDQVKAI